MVYRTFTDDLLDEELSHLAFSLTRAMRAFRAAGFLKTEKTSLKLTPSFGKLSKLSMLDLTIARFEAMTGSRFFFFGAERSDWVWRKIKLKSCSGFASKAF